MAWFKLPGILSGFVRRHVIADVPDDMSLCMACHVGRCSSERYASCPHRLADTAALVAFQKIGAEDDAGS